MPNYGDPKYWNKRYMEQSNTMFDWLEDYESLKEIIGEKIAKEGKILVLGCGNAEFSENMYDDGYTNIENIDISNVVIEQMAKRNEDRKEMSYQVMDVRDLQYPDNYFDMEIDKSTIDALLCGEEAFVNVAKMTKEIQRTLKVGGVYLVISYGRPENRLSHFLRDHLAFELEQYTISPAEEGENKDDKKKEEADEISKENFEKVLIELEHEYEEEKKLVSANGKQEDSEEEY